MGDSKLTTVFAPLDTGVFDRVTAVCIGTGRFLRAVLVPAVVELGGEVVLAQTRGTSFGEYMHKRTDRTYETDTVLQDGQVIISRFAVGACGSLGVAEGREAFLKLPSNLPRLRYVGLGLTEAGITHNGRSIIDLAEFLHACFKAGCGGEHPLSVINTDNMPFNGDAIRNHVRSCDFMQKLEDMVEFERWMQERVCFHNTMVDRITSFRTGEPDVPRAEPLPAKALVIEDLAEILPQQFGSVPGVVVRTQRGQLALDIALKLRIANGLHTAMVYVMALGRLFKTDACIGHSDVLPYLEQLFERDIVHCCAELSMPRLKVTPVFSEWMGRLQHPHFGLECFFVCQNATQKMGIRLLPSIKAALAAGEAPSSFMVFSLAVILRFLTPIGDQPRIGEHPPVFVGKLDEPASDASNAVKSWEYTTGLNVHPVEGTYEFRDGDGLVPLLLRPLGRPGGCSTAAATSLAGEVLSRLEGFDARSNHEHGRIAQAVGTLLQQLLQGKAALRVLADLKPQKPLYLDARNLEDAVQQEVDAAEAIDVHTHLFSAAYGVPFMQFGVDAMLTYHYLVSEFLATSQISPEDFRALSQREQADQVWDGLFITRSPVSEQCRSVLTTLSSLGLREEVAARDLDAIRLWYAGQDAEMLNEKMMRLARLRYVVTSHDPFEPEETKNCLSPPAQPPRYRNALSLDKLLEGKWESVRGSLESCQEPCTLQGVENLLQRCADALKPVFLTAATPHEFHYEDTLAGAAEVDKSLVLPESPDVILKSVVLPFCARMKLPLQLRMGTRRAVNPAFGLGGDGVGSARLESLGRLCLGHPRVKFMATVLGRVDQHEATVLAGRFRNLHLWGCWWHCSNPSLVAEITALRLEMLGTGFTFQASSARVHDHLIGKWIHARTLLSQALAAKYSALAATGWCVSRGDIRRDVSRLLGGAYEDFLEKPL